MEYINNTNEIKFNNTVVALGKFDGFHKGHMILIDKMLELSKNGLKSIVCSFDMKKKEILLSNEKADFLEKKGIDIYIEYPFTSDFAALGPEEFISKILIDKFGSKAVVVGDDFKFGVNRSGDINTLKDLSYKYDYKVYSMEKLSIDSEVVSSTRIRNRMDQSDISYANMLLGYNYYISGVVEHGRHLGRTIGFPTVNIIPDALKYLPKDGVYYTKAFINDAYYSAITNIGTNPTISENNNRTVETHILDFNEDIYGSNIKIYFIEHIRDEIKFKSISDLTEQLSKDIIEAKRLSTF